MGPPAGRAVPRSSVVGAPLVEPAPSAGLPAPGSMVNIPGPPLLARAPSAGLAVDGVPLSVPEVESTMFCEGTTAAAVA